MKPIKRYKVWVLPLFIFILCTFLFTILQSCKKLDFERVVRLKTGEVTDITANSAYIIGIIQDWGENGITQYGHCWSISENPTAFLETKTEYDSGNVGNIYSNLDSLLPGTTYYIRAYAISKGETIYGNNVPFKTNEASTPTITTLSPSNIADTFAASGGNVTSDGGATVTARGVCWSTSVNPTISDSLTTDGSGTGSFISNISGLTPNTTYHVRAYATNIIGTAYGNDLIFTTIDTINWQKSLGGSDEDWAYSIQQTTDGGYIIAGESSSSNGDVMGNHGFQDYWIVKLTSTLELDWQKSLGGSGGDIAYSIQQTTDGGYIIAGESSSSNGDVSENHGSADCWIVKLTSNGEIDWQKSLGGSNGDGAYSIQQTTDGGYIIAGFSWSNDGDVSGHHGSADYWIVKLTSTGILDWQKSLGGSGGDIAHSIQQTTDGGYIIAGYSYSDDGDILGNYGLEDYWIVKLTSNGEIDWQKSLGGFGNDYAHSIQQTTDGGYIISGESNINDGDVSGNHGFQDYWIVKLTSTGNLDWQKSLGGSGVDIAYSIQQTTDGGYIIAGYSESNDGDVSENKGRRDFWIVKLTSTGDIDWQKSLGGSESESAYSIQQTVDGGYVIIGYSWSNDGDVSGNHGSSDYWIVKISEN